jgi:flagellar biosynthesis chaperone FliJ
MNQTLVELAADEEFADPRLLRALLGRCRQVVNILRSLQKYQNTPCQDIRSENPFGMSSHVDTMGKKS